jgi:hypothetical protein
MEHSNEPFDLVGNTDKPFEGWAPLEINEPEEPFFVQQSPTYGFSYGRSVLGSDVRLGGSGFDVLEIIYPISVKMRWERSESCPLRSTHRCGKCNNCSGT